ncbi:GumC family protein [Halothermothrix orenii]|uniref:Lipopolysaccharide biosynthesis protein n=1 Tax=Halothermothrix orenii (strain H 168 / OCM 544 / DSM 9562) TaxID=373903 RepID=B8D0N1_HALOH|nr:GNVR domain-containing protein [Halothermothrix orenii]ACL70967.1 lipopolysaccharide biosynthesis protein [Halothermothrix orenii H 168]
MDNIPHNYEYEIDLTEYLGILNKRKWLILAITILAGVMGYILTSYKPAVFQSDALLMIDETPTTLNQIELSPFNNNNRDLITYSKLLKTRKLLKKVSQHFDENKVSVKYLITNLNIEIIPDTRLIKISIKHTDPVIARQIISYLIEEFIINNRNLKKSATVNARNYVARQLEKVSRDLKNIEAEVRHYKEENKSLVLSNFTQKIMQSMLDLEENLAEVEINIKTHRAALNHLYNKLQSSRELILSSKTLSKNPAYTELKNRLTELEIELDSLTTVYTDKHPEIIKLKAEKKSILNEISNTLGEVITSTIYTTNPVYNNLKQELVKLETELTSLKAQKESLNIQFQKIKAKTEQLPKKELEYSRLLRKLEVSEKLYTMLLTRYQELKITEAMKVSDIITVDPPVVPESPVGPNMKLNLAIAIIMGLFVGVFIAFILEFINNTIQRVEEIEEITDVPIIGYIPYIDKKNDGRDHNN